MATWDGGQVGRRMRVERGVYRQPNGKYAVCFMLTASPRFGPSATTSTSPGRSDAHSSRRRAGA
jgi:hypothetical protein